jgi:hypothetical protein
MASSLVVSAQTPTRGNVAILLDLSGSMNAELEGESRRDVAVEALSKTVEDIDGKASVALYAFGNNYDNSPSSKAESCQDINKLVDFNKSNAGEIKEILVGIEAKGWTPLAKSIETIGSDLSQFGDSEHHLIILSDGEESCNGDPIKAVENLKANGVNVIINTIGLDVNESTKQQLQEIATAGNGEYFDASDSDELSKSLNKAITTEEVEPQEKADFSADNRLPMGGSSFDDAVELSMDFFNGDAYGLPKHVEAGSYLTYKLPTDLLKVDPKLTVGGIVAPSVVIENGEATVQDEDIYASFNIDLFDKRKGAFLAAGIYGAPKETVDTYTYIEGQSLVYMFIGDEDEGLNKDSKVFFEYEPQNEDTVSDEDDNSDTSEPNNEEGDKNELDPKQSSDQDSESEASEDSLDPEKMTLYIAIGLGAVVFILIITLAVTLRKKKQ